MLLAARRAVTPHTCFGALALSAVAGLVGLACSSSSTLPSSFDSQGSSGASICSGAVTVLPPRGTGPAARPIVFHVTNHASDARWVQTEGDDACAPFDVLRGGAPVAIRPTRVCGCSCEPPESRATYRKLGPGDTLDITWDGIAQQPSALCVAGESFGCATGEVFFMPTSTPVVANALHYGITLHVESAAPAGCSEQGEGSWTCGGDGVTPGTQCVHGAGKVTMLLSLQEDAGSPRLDFELK